MKTGPRLLYRTLQWAVLLALLGSLAAGWRSGQAAPAGQDAAAAQEMLNRLTPRERVGQLVLVTFDGAEAPPGSAIDTLVSQYHIGGVVLRAANDNFAAAPETLTKAWQLNRQLQTIEWEAAQRETPDLTTGVPYLPAYIPLLIGISQDGDGYPHSQLLSGLTPLPNQMTIGATWKPALAEKAGVVLGSELSALGFNLLMGPSLDVLEEPSTDGAGDLGTRTFGGDPFWVAEMGKAYINGVHQGSAGRIALVGKYFPGRGSSDRLPEDEVATIRKTLEQLKQIELAPFFAVTGDAPSRGAAIDALLTSHIKYQGFQSNIRVATRPISFDPQAFNQLISLPAFASWRQNGGLMVSDELGSRAVRRFYDPSGETFNARFAARDALLAGNDLLYLGNFTANDDPDSFTTIVRTLDFFTQKYLDDPAFAVRVDEAVLRILALKYRLYPAFSLESVVPAEAGLAGIGGSEAVTFEIARSAASVISPAVEELDSLLPNPPGLSEQIVIFTDSYDIRQCSACPQRPVIEITALQQAILRLYGPEAGGQTQRRNLLSYSFENLAAMLDRGPGRTEVEFNLRSAQWAVFVMLDVRPDRPNSLALRRFLAERPDLLRGKQIVVFALNAPYFLDATDISKLSAYYALYSKTPQSIDVAARLLFNELRPINGALPVSVAGVGYDLITVTSPDPVQTIRLALDLPGQPAAPVAPAEAPAQPEFLYGDLVPVRTEVIVDHNGNPVPDNTPVTFFLSAVGERNTVIKEIASTTAGGIARGTFALEAVGSLEITARSDPATSSDIIRLNVPGERPSPTPEPSPTVTAQPPGPAPTATAPAAPIDGPGGPQPPSQLDALLNWLLAMGAGVAVSWAAYRVSLANGQVLWSMRIGLCVLIGGLFAFIYVSLALPGGGWLLAAAGNLAGILAMLAGNGLGLGAAWLWRSQTG